MGPLVTLHMVSCHIVVWSKLLYKRSGFFKKLVPELTQDWLLSLDSVQVTRQKFKEWEIHWKSGIYIQGWGTLLATIFGDNLPHERYLKFQMKDQTAF